MPRSATYDLSRWTAVPVEPSAMRPVVAAFDVDHTVTTRDCVVPFMCRVAGPSRVVAGLGWAAIRHLPAVISGDRNRLKAAAARAAFAGRPLADIDQRGEEFAAEVVASRLRADTVARLRWHAEQGHDVVLVSASFAAFLRPLARRIGGVAGVLGTELVVGPDGRCTGALLGGNCRGQEKVRRLHAWLDAHGGGRGAVDVWAYGDSPGDRELLADADHPVWTVVALQSAEPSLESVT